jgi:hypothetical protein
MNVFSVSSDALLHCFVLDEELSASGQATHKTCPELAPFVQDEREYDPKTNKE